MKARWTVAQGIAALVSLVLMMSAQVLWALGVSSAELISIETLDNAQFQKRISVRIGARVERLLVSPNPHLNNLRIVNSDGAVLNQDSTAYAGIVESLPNSWARIVVDDDYIAGTIRVQDAPLHFSSESSAEFTASQKTSEPLIPPPVSIRNLSVLRNPLHLDEVPDEISVPVSDRLAQTIGDVTRVIRIGIVVDTLYQEAIGGRGLSNAISTINSVDGLYREKFGLAFKVDVVVLVQDDTFLSIDEREDGQAAITLKDHLDLFREYRIESELLPADLGLVHLFTGVQAEDEAIGLAFQGAACRPDGHDVSMARPFRFPVLLTAHEIGHNLGALHDDTTDCRDNETNLMHSSISTTTTRDFSSCSTETINTRMQQSTCFTGVIDIDLQVTQLESNQIQVSVTNLDETRAFPAATLMLDLNNATIAEAPAICELADPAKLACNIPATFAGDTQDLAIKLRFEPDLERTVLIQLEPEGFFDLNSSNNALELIIPGDPQPLASTEGEIITQVASETASNFVDDPTAAVSNGSRGGGGSIGYGILLLLFAAAVNRRNCSTLTV